MKHALKRIAAVLAGAWLGGITVTSQAAEAAGALEVKAARPGRGEIHRFVSLPGTLRADQQVTLYPKVAGYLKTISVDKGDQVRAGQVLAEIEVPELVADVARHRADVEVAAAAFNRLSVAQAKSPDLITPAALDEAKARLQVAQASLARTETLLGYTHIVAPFSGTITMRFADVGAFVAAPSAGGTAQNAALFALADFRTIRLQVPVPEIEAARVRPGQPVKLAVDGLAGRVFAALVSRLGYALDEATRTMLVEADFPNPDGELRPGMYAKARIGVEKHTDTLLIPVEALVMEKMAAFAFTAVDGKAKKHPLTIGFNDGQQVEVLKGLEATQPVILVGKLVLAPEQPVKVTEVK
ncbi:MAG: efflux RND transporter periplasmic adaptor subunit [Opitutus sp.]|nr:efflux RND transporter periplasmic adaptor subunit [Opitutus sp.]